GGGDAAAAHRGKRMEEEDVVLDGGEGADVQQARARPGRQVCFGCFGRGRRWAAPAVSVRRWGEGLAYWGLAVRGGDGYGRGFGRKIGIGRGSEEVEVHAERGNLHARDGAALPGLRLRSCGCALAWRAFDSECGSSVRLARPCAEVGFGDARELVRTR